MAELLEPFDLNTMVPESNETISPDTIEPEPIVASSEDTDAITEISLPVTKDVIKPNSSEGSLTTDTISEGYLCPLTGLITYPNESSDINKSGTLTDVSISSSNDIGTKQTDESITYTTSESSRVLNENDRPNSNGVATNHLITSKPKVPGSEDVDQVSKNVPETREIETPVTCYDPLVPEQLPTVQKTTSPQFKFDNEDCKDIEVTNPQPLPPISTIRRNLNLGTQVTEPPSCFTSVSVAGESSLSSAPEFYNTQSASTGLQNSYYSDLLGYVPDFTDLYHQSLTSLWQPYVEEDTVGVTHPSLQQSSNSTSTESFSHTCPSQPLGSINSSESHPYQNYQPSTQYNPGYGHQSYASGLSWSQSYEPYCTLEPTAQAQPSYQCSQNDSNAAVQSYYHRRSPRDYTKSKNEIYPPNVPVQLQANGPSAVDYAYYAPSSGHNKPSNETRPFEQPSRGFLPQSCQAPPYNQSVDQSARGYLNQSNQAKSCQSSTYDQPTIHQQPTGTKGFVVQPTQSHNFTQAKTGVGISSSTYIQHIPKTETQNQQQQQKLYGHSRMATQGTSVLKNLLKSPYARSCEALELQQRMVGRSTAANLKREDAESQKFRHEYQKIEQPSSTQKPNIVVLRQATSTLSQNNAVSSQLRHYAALESQQNAYNAARANMNMLDQIEQLRRHNTVREILDYQRSRANYSQPPQASKPQRAPALSYQVQPAPAARGLPPPYCVKWSILNERGIVPNATNVQRSTVPNATNVQRSTVPSAPIQSRPPPPTRVTGLDAEPGPPVKTMLSTIVQSLPPFKEGKVNAKDHKPRHYDMIRLEIGAFVVEGPPEGAKKLTSRIKVLFTRRRFVYEFELNLPKALISGGIGFETALFCVHVPFITIDVISCHENLVRLLVNRQPEMYFGTKNSRAGSGSSYDTTQRVDVTSGEMAKHPLHKIFLKKNQAEKLKNFLRNFDERFIRMLRIPIIEPIPSRPLAPATTEEIESLRTLPPVFITRVTTTQPSVQVPDSKTQDTHIRVMTQNVQIHPQLKRPSVPSPAKNHPIPVKQAKSSEPKRTIEVGSPTTRSQSKKSSPERVEQLRKIPETQIAGIVKLPEDEIATSTSPTPAHSPIDLTKITDTEEPRDSCSCRTSCRSLRCACAKEVKNCNPSCTCNNCDNPLNILEAHAVNVEEAMKDTCLNTNIYKVMHLEYYLNRTVKLGCCEETVRYLDCIPGQKNCPGCNTVIKYSWCRGIVCLESECPRRHCEVCNKCAFPEHQLYCLCNKPKKQCGAIMDNNISVEENQD